jgi:phenylpyruvate tautomerase PptA (4-oxalocrotonate tautomerase family)
MDMTNESKSPESANGLSRRDILMTATATAGALAAMPGGASAASISAEAFGAPLVELHVPANALTAEQKSDMIKGVTDVLVDAIKLPQDRMKKLWVQIFETAEGGWGVGGQVFVPHNK